MLDLHLAGMAVARNEPAADALVAAIVTGDVGAGKRLDIGALAQRFNTTRQRMRQIAGQLEVYRLVKRLSATSLVVADLPFADFESVYAVREALESVAAREAARHATLDEIARLGVMIGDYHMVLSAPKLAVDDLCTLDIEFHRFIVACSRNDMLDSMLSRQHYEMLILNWRRLFSSAARSVVEHRLHVVFLEHCRIVDAIEDRDGDMATIVMRRHVQGSLAHLVMARDAIAAAAPANGSTGKPAARRRPTEGDRKNEPETDHLE